jgi:hypothetical protein
VKLDSGFRRDDEWGKSLVFSSVMAGLDPAISVSRQITGSSPGDDDSFFVRQNDEWREAVVLKKKTAV